MLGAWLASAFSLRHCEEAAVWLAQSGHCCRQLAEVAIGEVPCLPQVEDHGCGAGLGGKEAEMAVERRGGREAISGLASPQATASCPPAHPSVNHTGCPGCWRMGHRPH